MIRDRMIPTISWPQHLVHEPTHGVVMRTPDSVSNADWWRKHPGANRQTPQQAAAQARVLAIKAHLP